MAKPTEKLTPTPATAEMTAALTGTSSAATSPLVGSTLVAPLDMFTSSSAFEHVQRVARAYANNDIVPKRFRATPDNPNALANCIVALEMTARLNAAGLNVGPLMIMQNLYDVNGQPAWLAQFVIAIINSAPKFKHGTLDYQITRDKDGNATAARAFATSRISGKPVYGSTVSVEMAKKEGWWDRKNSKCPNMQEYMLIFRAAAFFGREYCSELLLGMRTTEEAEDIIDITPTRSGVAGAKEMLVQMGQTGQTG